MKVLDWIIFIVGVIIALIIFILCRKKTCPYCQTSSNYFDDQIWNKPCKHCGRGMTNKKGDKDGDSENEDDNKWMFRQH